MTINEVKAKYSKEFERCAQLKNTCFDLYLDEKKAGNSEEATQWESFYEMWLTKWALLMDFLEDLEALAD